MSEISLVPDLEAAIAGSAEVAAKIRELTDRGVAYAQSIAPVLTGEYRDSIHAEMTEEGGKPAGRIVAGTDHWEFIEFGTSDTPTFATLRRALEGVRAE